MRLSKMWSLTKCEVVKKGLKGNKNPILELDSLTFWTFCTDFIYLDKPLTFFIWYFSELICTE